MVDCNHKILERINPAIEQCFHCEKIFASPISLELELEIIKQGIDKLRNAETLEQLERLSNLKDCYTNLLEKLNKERRER